jgi:hypothetical protein
MSRSTTVVCLPVVLGLAIFGAGCGQGFDRDAAIDSFQQANPDASGTQAACVVDRQIDRFGLDGLADQLDTDPPTDEFVDIQFRDMFACGMDGDVEEQLVELLQDSGVDAEAAPCVATEIVAELDDEDIDVLVSGDITDTFMSKFIAAMTECGAAGTGG